MEAAHHAPRYRLVRRQASLSVFPARLPASSYRAGQSLSFTRPCSHALAVFLARLRASTAGLSPKASGAITRGRQQSTINEPAHARLARSLPGSL